MTSEERAEAIVLEWNRSDGRPIRELIAQALRECRKEALEEAAQRVEELIDIEDPAEDQQIIRACASTVRKLKEEE